MAVVQTLFTNDDVNVAERPRRMVINAVGSLFFAVFVLTSLHDVALALVFIVLCIAGILGAFRLVPVRLLGLVVVGAFAAVGIAEIRSGPSGIGCICCAWALVIAASFVLAQRRRPAAHPLE
jgi:hypothetical protein